MIERISETDCAFMSQERRIELWCFSVGHQYFFRSLLPHFEPPNVPICYFLVENTCNSLTDRKCFYFFQRFFSFPLFGVWIALMFKWFSEVQKDLQWSARQSCRILIQCVAFLDVDSLTLIINFQNSLWLSRHNSWWIPWWYCNFIRMLFPLHELCLTLLFLLKYCYEIYLTKLLACYKIRFTVKKK